MKRLNLTLLGGFDARTDDSHPVEILNRKERALLAWLGMNAGQHIGREAAAAILWGDRAQKQANASLSQALYTIRKALAAQGCDTLSADRVGIMLDANRVRVDALEFRRLAGSADAERLAAAVDMYTAPLLEGMAAPTADFEEWLESERRQLKDEALDALSTLLTTGEGHEAEPAHAATARRLLALDPFSEQATRALMLHHASRGQLGAAVEAFEQLECALRTELGAAPSEETCALREHLLGRQSKAPEFDRQDPMAEAPPRQSGPQPKSRARVLVALLFVVAVVAGAAYRLSVPAHEFAPTDRAAMLHALPARPSIAVMAFEDLSQGDDRGYLSDAIAEGIITQLSYFPELFVIARNSSFHYRDTESDVRSIARELGVRYILEGSQQKSAERLRVTLQLIDAIGGHHVWSRTFNRDLADILAVQDEIAASVASTLGEKLRKVAGEEATRANPDQLRAYQNVLKGNHYFNELTREGSDKAMAAYHAALVLDPDMAPAHTGVAWIHLNGYRWGWTVLDRGEALEQARKEAAIALHLAPADYRSHFTMAVTLMHSGERERAFVEFEKALELNPNSGDVMATYAEQLGYAGRFDEAAAWLRKAMRLDPHHPEWFFWNLGWAQYSMGKCGAALDTMTQMSNPPPLANRTLAAIFVCLDRPDDARQAISDLLVFDPDYSIRKFKMNFQGKYANSADFDAWVAALRQAGLPD